MAANGVWYIMIRDNVERAVRRDCPFSLSECADVDRIIHESMVAMDCCSCQGVVGQLLFSEGDGYGSVLGLRISLPASR